MKRKASIHGKTLYGLSSPTAHYLNHKVCLYPFVCFFFLPQFLYHIPLFFFLHSFLSSLLSIILLSLSQFISFLPSTLLTVASFDRFVVFVLSSTRILRVNYHLVSSANLHTINNHHLPSNPNLLTVNDHLLSSPNLLPIDNHCQVLTYSQVIIITCYHRPNIITVKHSHPTKL